MMNQQQLERANQHVAEMQKRADRPRRGEGLMLVGAMAAVFLAWYFS